MSSIGASSPRCVSLILKVSIFATGLAGIVAEYVLSTLATYLLGNAVFQWTIVMSLMLFAMGLGSRVSKYFSANLLDLFIFVEFTLSLLCASASVVTYGLAPHVAYIDLIIYSLSLCIGLLIGFEIPLVTRINEQYEDLRTNIAMVMEKDYYGALVGGFLFAFFAVPHLGLTYTPMALGAVNFLVAALFTLSFLRLLHRKRAVLTALAACGVCLVALALLASPIIRYGEQSQYVDVIIHEEQTPYQKIVMTRWKDHHWLYINSQVQFSSYDEERYHEPLTHPAMLMAASREKVLILGGGDGLAAREALKYDDLRSLTLVDMDPAMTRLAREHPVLRELNKDALRDPRLQVANEEAGAFLRASKELYSVIIIDLPDPDSLDLMHVYSLDFYRLVRKHLQAGGVVVTQATSPYFSPLAFLCIQKTMQAAGLRTLPYHGHVPTMGQWGWILAMRDSDVTAANGENPLKVRMQRLDPGMAPTRYLNREIMAALPLFGKGLFDHPRADDVEVNTRHKPALMRYYRQGNWAVY